MAPETTDPPSPAGLTHSTWPGNTSPGETTRPDEPPRFTAEAPFDASGAASSDGSNASTVTRWMGWRLRLLVVGALIGCLGAAMLIRTLALAPHLDASWRVAAHGGLELGGSAEAALQPHLGQTVTGVTASQGKLVLLDARVLQRSLRWVVSDIERARLQSMHIALTNMQRAETVKLHFADGTSAEVRPVARGAMGLAPMFWLLTLFGLALYLLALVVALANPSLRNLLYGAMAWFQAGNLLLMGVETTCVLGLPGAWEGLSMPIHVAFDLLTAAAMLHAACVHPRRLPHADAIALGGWLCALVVIGLCIGDVANVWWWVQGTVLAFGLSAICLLSWSYRIEAHPFALVLRRLGVVIVVCWTLLSGVLVVADELQDLPARTADVGALGWTLFLGALLLLVPFLARSQRFTREFSLLAAISTIATSLDLLFVAVFSLGQFASLTLALFLSFAVYSGVRQWILSQLRGSSMLTTERMFEQLYRIAREVEAHPERTPALLSQLLANLFEPLESTLTHHASRRSRVSADGSGLLVPVPSPGGDGSPAGSVMMRFAQRGRRLFTAEDARLTDRIVEQLRRAVRFDKAVEQGRKEERMRLAQDLHDDIGARLLTLMYQAQSPEMEEYVRHTLQDLKTLTRGLAASNHPLSHAAAEWKADLTHRLTVAHVELMWHVAFDRDLMLTVVHWSALTRILRELVSNAIAHSKAHRVQIDLRLADDRFELTIADDGVGRDPRAWSHGLGLGGVRKRVKQLGGTVGWRGVEPRGIRCDVVIERFSARA